MASRETDTIFALLTYLGAKIADDRIFERVLWPQRFYNNISWKSVLSMIFFMPMGGPLHRAALSVLDTFREQGIYRGTRREIMLGSAFFHDSRLIYYDRTAGVNNKRHDCRNAFWVNVLRHVDTLGCRRELRSPQRAEDPKIAQRRTHRARQQVHHLHLEDSKTIQR